MMFSLIFTLAAAQVVLLAILIDNSAMKKGAAFIAVLQTLAAELVFFLSVFGAKEIIMNVIAFVNTMHIQQ